MKIIDQSLQNQVMLRNHKNAKSTALNIHGKYQIYTKFDDNVERIEEWMLVISKNQILKGHATRTDNGNKDAVLQLSMRKWKDSSSPSSLQTKTLNSSSKSHGCWEYEIGRPHASGDENTNNTSSSSTTKTPRNTNDGLSEQQQEIMISISSKTPTFYAEDSHSHFVWKVENCPWPSLENYILSIIDETKQWIALKTKNKKFYKVFQIPAMSRLNLRVNVKLFHLKYDDDDDDGADDRCQHSGSLTIFYQKPEAILTQEKEEAKLRDDAIARVEKDGDVDCRQS